ncbi:MAG: alpha-amylase family glycosyl hydrolase, partial [bacterium]
AKKLLATEYFLLRGLPWIYQGQELGMENCPVSDISEVDDISALNEYEVALAAGKTKEEALHLVGKYSRDNARTPYQWDSSANAGFTTGTPWLSVNPNYKWLNRKAEEADPDSLLSYYKQLVQLRKSPAYADALIEGELIPYLPEQKNLMAYLRKGENQTILVCGNFQKEAQDVKLPAPLKTILLGNYPEVNTEGNIAHLEGYQIFVAEI